MSQPELPQPTIGTFLPRKMSARLYEAVWRIYPSNLSWPSNSGMLGSERIPLAIITPA
jgi:hypothetical protein